MGYRSLTQSLGLDLPALLTSGQDAYPVTSEVVGYLLLLGALGWIWGRVGSEGEGVLKAGGEFKTFSSTPRPGACSDLSIGRDCFPPSCRT